MASPYCVTRAKSERSDRARWIPRAFDRTDCLHPRRAERAVRDGSCQRPIGGTSWRHSPPRPSPDPLDPLDAEEIARAVGILRRAASAWPAGPLRLHLFARTSHTCRPGARTTGAAERDRRPWSCSKTQRGRTYEAVVSLTYANVRPGDVVPDAAGPSCSTSSWSASSPVRPVPTGRPPCATAVSTDFDLCMVDPWSARNSRIEAETSCRLSRAPPGAPVAGSTTAAAPPCRECHRRRRPSRPWR